MKKTSLSRILSIAIILCMVAALLPATVICAGAADAGYTIVYDFIDNYAEGTYSKDSVTVQFYTPTINLVDSYEKSNGFWKFATSASGLYIDHQYAPSSAWNNGLLAYFNADGRDWYAIKINVPVAGTYMASIGTIATSGHETNLEVYMLDDEATQEEIASSIEAGTGKIGEVNCTSGGYSALDSERRELSSKELSAGEHIVAFHAKNGKSAKIWSFMLKSGDGSKTVPMSVSASASKTELDVSTVGDSATISIDSVMYSNTTTASASASDFVFTSNDSSMLDVDANGVVTVADGALPGTASVSIAAKDNPSFVLDTISFDVVVKNTTNTKVVYDFIDNYADGVPYTVSENNFFTSSVNVVDTYEKANGFWKFHEMEASLSVNHKYNTTDPRYNGLNAYVGAGKTWFSINVNVPVTDIYKTVLCYDCDSAYDSAFEVYLLNGVATKAEIATSVANGTNLLGTVDCTNGKQDGTQTKEFRTKRLSAGEYTIVFRAPTATAKQSRLHSFSLVAGNGSVAVPMSASLELSETNASISKVYMSDASAVTSLDGITVSYKSSEPDVATVNAATGAIEKLSNGETEISATVTKNDVSTVAKKTLTVTGISNAPGEAVASPTVAFTADAEAGGTVTDKGEVKQVEIGGSVTVEATANEGYTFAYWRNAGGKHLSSNAKETFKVNTNTAVIAVFDKNVEEGDETVPVYFYNENGSLITKKSVTKGTDFGTAVAGVSKSLTGKIFESWSIDNSFIINEPTYAVAQYTADPTEYSVTVDGTPVATGAYGEKATVTGSESFSYWKLGNNIVSYDKTYEFYIWGDITLEEVTGEAAEPAPTVAINAQGDNYFIAYNVPSGYTLLEAGIVFGKTGSTPKIDGFYSKAAAELNNGQFTAMKADGTETVSRGYIMFRDNTDGKVRVIYAD